MRPRLRPGRTRSGVHAAGVAAPGSGYRGRVHPSGLRGATAWVTDMVRQRHGLRRQDHRPWPVPDGRWLMGQTWHDLLFAHWGVDPDRLRAVVPREIPLDVRDGSCWVGVTPFEISGLRLIGTPPLPRISRFGEINVR